MVEVGLIKGLIRNEVDLIKGPRISVTYTLEETKYNSNRNSHLRVESDIGCSVGNLTEKLDQLSGPMVG